MIVEEGRKPHIEYIVDRAGKLFYANKVFSQNLPAPMISPSELIALSRPRLIADDVTGLEQFCVWFARWLALCSPLDEQAQDEVCVRFLFGRVPDPYSYTGRKCRRNQTSDAGQISILFLLALIEAGASTPYQLQKDAALSQGATSPALQRLLQAGLVRQGKPGSRGRIDYKVSAAGRKALRDGWRPLIAAGPTGDLDSDLRVALLALFIGGDRVPAANFLRKSAEGMVESVSVGATRAIEVIPPLARWYTDLRSQATLALLKAESEAFLEIAASLPRQISAKSSRHTTASKKTKAREGVSKGS